MTSRVSYLASFPLSTRCLGGVACILCMHATPPRHLPHVMFLPQCIMVLSVHFAHVQHAVGKVYMGTTLHACLTHQWCFLCEMLNFMLQFWQKLPSNQVGSRQIWSRIRNISCFVATGALKILTFCLLAMPG